MRANEYRLMEEAVEAGVNRCPRWLSKRGQDAAAVALEIQPVKDVIVEMVMNEISERWHFEGGNE